MSQIDRRAIQVWQILIICLTETWHKDTDDVPIRRLRADGFQVLERERPIAATAATDTINYTNHGGVAIVAPTRVKDHQAVAQVRAADVRVALRSHLVVRSLVHSRRRLPTRL